MAADRGRPRAWARPGPGLGAAQRGHVAQRARRAGHRPARPPRRRPAPPDRGVARRGPGPAPGGRRAAARRRRPPLPSTWRSPTRSAPPAPSRSSSTASSPARCAAWRCAASSTTRTRAPSASRSASAPTTAKRSPSSTATSRPAEALAGVVAAVAGHRRADAPQHPLSRLVPERLVRWRLEQDPGQLGLAVDRRGATAGAPAGRQGPGAVLGHRPASRRLAGARRLLGGCRPRPDPVRARRPARCRASRLGGGAGGGAGARPRADHGRDRRVGGSAVVAGAVLRLIVGRDVDRRERLGGDSTRRGSAVAAAATVTVRRPSAYRGRHLLGIEGGAEADAAAPRQLVGRHRDRQHAIGDGDVERLGGVPGRSTVSTSAPSFHAASTTGVRRTRCHW